MLCKWSGFGRPLDHLRLGTDCSGPNYVISELEIVVPLPNLWREKRGWRLNQLPTASDLINHDFVKKSQ